MDAIEFVKRFGWKEAQICLLNCAMPQDRWFMHRGELIEGQDFDDLKQIVDALELVGVYGGLELAKEFISEYSSFPFRGNLVKAINLVEQCNASD